MKLKKSLIFIMLCICLSWSNRNYTFAQNVKMTEKEKPSECEYMGHSLNYSLVEAKQNQNSSIIFIFYLGKKDSLKNLNEQRKNKLEAFLKDKIPDSKQFVIAEGKRRNGLGKIEIYIKGNLIWELFYKKNTTNCVE